MRCGPAGHRTIDDDQIAAVIERTLRSTPTDATHWSIRSMAGAHPDFHTRRSAGSGRRSACSRIARRPSSFPSDPLFETRSAILSASALSPPNRALVLSVDEKSQIQALDREQPVLPMMLSVPERRTLLLYPSWYDFVICRARCRLGFCHRQMLQAPPRDRISRLPQADRRSGSQRPRRPHHHGQLRYP